MDQKGSKLQRACPEDEEQAGVGENMQMSDKEALLAKLEVATEGTRELDLEVLNALGGKHAWYWHDRDIEIITCDRYGHAAVGNPICSLAEFTSSIDDALSIIPHKFNWILGRGKMRDDEPPYGVQIFLTDGNADDVVAEAQSVSAPIAICIAALRARPALNKTEARKAVAAVIYRKIRHHASQAQIEAAAYSAGYLHGLTRAEVCAVAQYIVNLSTRVEAS